MDWNSRIKGAVCWRPVGASNQQTRAWKGDERKVNLQMMEAVVGDTREALEYIQAGPDGPRTSQTRERPTKIIRQPDSFPPLSAKPSSTARQPTTSLAAFLNNDVLTTIFMHLADSSLQSPPSFQRGTKDAGGPFLTISRRAHPDRSASERTQQIGDEMQHTLRACTLVSRVWYEAAAKLLWFTAVLHLEHLEAELARWGGGVIEEETEKGAEMCGNRGDLAWNSRVRAHITAPWTRWVRRLVLIGGGMRSTESPSSRLSKIWHMFPCIQYVEIFGLGWGTDGLLSVGKPFPLETVPSVDSTIPDSFNRIQTLEITATSDYLLRDMAPGQNFLDTVGLLGLLPALKSLKLRGFTYRLPSSSTAAQLGNALPPASSIPTSKHTLTQKQSISLPYALNSLVLDKCSLSLVALRWLVGWHSCATLLEMETEGCSFWDGEDGDGVWSIEDDIDDAALRSAFDAIVQRLSVDLPVFTMSTRC